MTYSFKSSRALTVLSLGAGAALSAAPAFAHHFMGGRAPQTLTDGLLSGLAHPIIGVDHLLFLVAIALLSLLLRTPARYAVPALFVLGTLAGTAMDLGGGAEPAVLPFVEPLVALSVVVGGALLLFRPGVGVTVLAALFSAAGLVHGVAYAQSIVGAEASALGAYLIGFTLIQYLVIVAGTIAAERLGLAARASRTRRGVGGALALAGTFILFGSWG